MLTARRVRGNIHVVGYTVVFFIFFFTFYFFFYFFLFLLFFSYLFVIIIFLLYFFPSFLLFSFFFFFFFFFEKKKSQIRGHGSGGERKMGNLLLQRGRVFTYIADTRVMNGFCDTDFHSLCTPVSSNYYTNFGNDFGWDGCHLRKRRRRMEVAASMGVCL